MADSTLHALILRRWDRGESDRRVTILTRERGRMDVIARGARKSGSRLASSTEPLNFVRMQVTEGKGANFVTQVEPIRAFQGLRTDYLRLSVALAYAELVAVIAHHELIQEEMFDQAETALAFIERSPDICAAGVWSELKLLEVEGVLPQFAECVQTNVSLKENPAYFSHSAGGYVHSSVSHEVADRVLVDGKVLISLARCAEMSEPPAKMALGEDCMRFLFRVWQDIAHAPMPAHEALMKLLQMNRA